MAASLFVVVVFLFLFSVVTEKEIKATMQMALAVGRMMQRPLWSFHSGTGRAQSEVKLTL